VRPVTLKNHFYEKINVLNQGSLGILDLLLCGLICFVVHENWSQEFGREDLSESSESSGLDEC
jgi:hypothetical protein